MTARSEGSSFSASMLRVSHPTFENRAGGSPLAGRADFDFGSLRGGLCGFVSGKEWAALRLECLSPAGYPIRLVCARDRANTCNPSNQLFITLMIANPEPQKPISPLRSASAR